MGDSNFKITCTYPDFNTVRTVEIPLDHKSNAYTFGLNVSQPGNHQVNCQDNAGNGKIEVFQLKEENPAGQPASPSSDGSGSQNTSY